MDKLKAFETIVAVATKGSLTAAARGEGVAPAVIAYGCGMQGLWDRIILGFFVAAGVSRLARALNG